MTKLSLFNAFRQIKPIDPDTAMVPVSQGEELEYLELDLPEPAPWVQGIVCTILIALSIGFGWALLAKLAVVISARGQLDPLSSSQPIQSRTGGLVTAVLVTEGQSVKKGQLLITLDQTPINSRNSALTAQKAQIVAQTSLLRSAQQNVDPQGLIQQGVTIAPEDLNRIQRRFLLEAQITGDTRLLSSSQSARFESFQRQLASQSAVNQIQSAALEAQLTELDAQLREIDLRISAKQALYEQLKALVENGVISRTDYLNRTDEVNGLRVDRNRIRSEIAQAKLSQQKISAQAQTSLGETRAQLETQLAELDAQIDSTIENNQRQLMQINAELQQSLISQKEQELRAPLDGTISNLTIKVAGAIAQAGAPILQVTPQEDLIARVQIPNADIANIRVGMSVDVRLDSYPFTEFGSISGIVSKVGSEALPAKQPGLPPSFPVEVVLNQQTLQSRSQSKQFPILAGMSLSAQITTGSRTPASLVAEDIFRVFDSANAIRTTLPSGSSQVEKNR